MPRRGAVGILLTLLAGGLLLGGSARAAGVWWLDSLAARHPLPAALPDGVPPPRLPAGADEAEALLCHHVPDLPVYVDSTVLRLAAWYGGPDWPRWQQWRRAARPLVEAAEVECGQRGLPLALALLPLALSGGDPAAGTPLGQAGPWQLDMATARRAGLRVDASSDERRDPARAATVALDRFQELRRRHGDAHALAAFACGPANLTRALARGAEELPGLAANMEPGEREILPLTMAFLLLEALTPEARAWPPLPWPEALPGPAVVESRPAPLEDQSDTPRTIRVRRGDTLEELARRHGVSVSRLRRANGIKGDRIRAGDRLRLPDPEGAGTGGDASTGRRLTGQAGKTTFRTYTVRPGDTLSGIAARHPGVSVRDLMDANQITDRIHPGQHLRIPLP